MVELVELLSYALSGCRRGSFTFCTSGTRPVE